jgi:hypothetical protein
MKKYYFSGQSIIKGHELFRLSVKQDANTCHVLDTLIAEVIRSQESACTGHSKQLRARS